MQTPPKPTPQAATTATAFVSASEKRSKHYTEVLEPVRRAREAEANKDKIVSVMVQQHLHELFLPLSTSMTLEKAACHACIVWVQKDWGHLFRGSTYRSQPLPPLMAAVARGWL